MLCERKYHLSKIKVTFCTHFLGLPRENNNFFALVLRTRCKISGNFHSGSQKKLVQKSTTFIFFKKQYLLLQRKKKRPCSSFECSKYTDQICEIILSQSVRRENHISTYIDFFFKILISTDPLSFFPTRSIAQRQNISRGV